MGGEDPVDDAEHVLLVVEADGGDFDPAIAFDVDVVGAVGHDLGDGGVVEEGLEGAIAPEFGFEFALEVLAVEAAEGAGLLGEDLLDDAFDEGEGGGAVHGGVAGAEFADDAVLDAQAELEHGVGGRPALLVAEGALFLPFLGGRRRDSTE